MLIRSKRLALLVSLFRAMPSDRVRTSSVPIDSVGLAASKWRYLYSDGSVSLAWAAGLLMSSGGTNRQRRSAQAAQIT